MSVSVYKNGKIETWHHSSIVDEDSQIFSDNLGSDGVSCKL